MTASSAHGRTQAPSLWRKRISPWLLQGLSWPFGFLLLRYFAHLKIEGKANLQKVIRKRRESPELRGVIFAINHTSELDPVVLLSGLHPFSPLMPMFYVTADRSQFAQMRSLRSKVLYRAWFFNAWGAYAIKRGTHSYEESLEAHLSILREGGSVAIFPEGRVRKDTSAAPEAHGGIAYLAENTDAIVVPVSIHNTQPYSARRFWKRNNTVIIHYGAPTEVHVNHKLEHAYRETAQKLLDDIYEQIPA